MSGFRVYDKEKGEYADPEKFYKNHKGELQFFEKGWEGLEEVDIDHDRFRLEEWSFERSGNAATFHGPGVKVEIKVPAAITVDQEDGHKSYYGPGLEMRMQEPSGQWELILKTGESLSVIAIPKIMASNLLSMTTSLPGKGLSI